MPTSLQNTGSTTPPLPDTKSRAEVLQGMACLDTSGNRRIPILMEMVAALSRATEPKQVLREFAEGFLKLQGPSGYVSLSTRGLQPGEYKITRLVTGSVVTEMSNADPWRDWSSLPVHRGGFFGALIRKAYPEIIHSLDLRDDPVVGNALAKYKSLMAIPLFDGGEPLNWTITLREDPQGFTVQELEELILPSNLGGATVKNVMITQQLRDAHAEIQREVEQIAKIQRALLPQKIPSIPGLKIGVSYETFDIAGGDMYTLRPLRRTNPTAAIGESSYDPNGPWGILVADVSGHGPAAAVVMAIMQSVIETYQREPAGPAEVLEHANHYLITKRIEQRFVTALFAIYDPITRQFTYSRAGHNPPLLMWPQPGREISRLEGNGGVPLGIMAGESYGETSITLAPGQTLVLYTDGITEATSPAGKMFDVNGIERSLTDCTGEPDCVIDHLTTAVREHEAGIRPRDDQTLVVIRVEPTDS